jgi:phage terminase large subunit GpA-like protein
MTAVAHAYDWLPAPPLRRFRLFPGEKAVFRARAEQTAAQWAPGERYIAVSPMPGPYDPDVTPQLTGLLELYSQEWLRELYLAGGSQSAKTDFMHTCSGYDAVHEPGPELIVMQDRDTCVETVSDRLIPMIDNTPSLRALKTGNPDDISGRRIKLRNGHRTYLGWAQSEGRLASKPIRYGKFDEVDLWPESAIRKARARFRAFEDSYKVIEACTASVESGRIWQAKKQAQAVLDFWPVCPHCEKAHVMEFANVRWGEGIVDAAALGDKGSAWYVCPLCEKPWDEEDRNEAVRLGAQVHKPPHAWHGWRPRGEKIHPRPARVWAHIPPLISRFVPFHKIAAAYLVTLTEPTAANLQYFYNDCLGLPVPEDAQGELTSEKELHARREAYAPEGADWQVPMAAVILTGDADVQSNRIEVEVVAWGPGHESWGIEYKVFHGDTSKDDVWDQAHEWAEKATYRHESGADLPIHRLGIDLGYRTTQVEKFVKRSRKYLAHKGSNTRGLPLVPRKPSKTRKYKVPFYELGVDTGKDTLMGWLSVTAPGPRCCHFPMTYDFEYFRMLCAERPVKEKNKKTGKLEVVWKLRDGFVRNEALDVRVGNMAVREIVNPNYEKLAEYLRQQAAAMQRPQPSEAAPEKKAVIQRAAEKRRRW